MKIVVDTNIVFSALLNSNSTIGDVIFNSHDLFEFYSCSLMKDEIENHWGKLLKISKISNLQLETAYQLVNTKLKYIDEALIPVEIWEESEIITNQIDPKDIEFVALTKYLDGTLWTGDKLLLVGLKDFIRTISTADLNRFRMETFDDIQKL